MSRFSVIAICVVFFAVAALCEDDYYDILDLTEREDASAKTIKSNWRRLSRDNHPDIKGESFRDRYVKIQRAYEVLSDRKKRIVYEMRGEEGLKDLEKPEGQGQQMDPFMHMFGGGGGQKGANRGPSQRLLLLANLEDIYTGATHTMQFQKQRVCRKCRGSGSDLKSEMTTCKKCRGSGHIEQRIEIMPGFVQQQRGPCPKCKGKGKQYKKKCAACGGRKITRGQQKLHIDIDAGIPENHEIKFEMEADQNPDQIPGDVIFNVQTVPHKRFTRDGDDLRVAMPITLSQALFGFETTIRHLDDHEVTVEEEGIVKHGQERVLSGEGMPVHHVPSERGQLTIKYEFTLPTHLSQDQKTKLGEIFAGVQF